MSYRIGANIAVSLLILGIDQSTKQLALVQNRAIFNLGIAFGLFADTNGLMVVMSLLVIVGVVLVGRSSRQPLVMSVLVSAAISNGIDRLRFGAVVDWLPVPGFNITNNLADWVIVGALFWLVVTELQKNSHSSK